MLPSMRHFLRFIDLDSTFDKYGFKIKVRDFQEEYDESWLIHLPQKGGMFKMNSKPRVCK